MPLINFSGIASGIDSEALIEAMSSALRQQRVEPNEVRITELEDENSALDEHKSLLTELKSILSKFTSLQGGGTAKQAVTSNDALIGAVASSAAAEGTYQITVNQVATNHTFSFDNMFSNASDTVLGAGESDTLTIDIGTGPAETITVDLTDATTWDQLTAEINSKTDLATASLVQVTDSPKQYQLVLTSNKTGTTEGLISVSTLPNQSTLDPTVGVGATESPAQNALFSMTGVAGVLQRTSNTINGLIPGVTLSLKGASATPITVTVRNDQETTKANVREFVDHFNEIVEFLNENNLIERQKNGGEVTNIFGPLASTRVDDNSLQSLRTAMSGSSYAEGTRARIFADLGIKTDRDGTLDFDEDAFTEALQNDPSAVEQILRNFADKVAMTNGAIDQFIRFQGLIDSTVNGNNKQIDNLQDRIARAEESIARQEEQLRARFARLESLIGGLQNQQAALTSALAGLGG